MSAETAIPSETGRIDLGKRIVNFVGPEGSGKSTIAKMLAQDSGKPFLSVGDILRYFAANDQGVFGQTAREMFEKHLYFMNRQMLLDMYAERFQSEELADGFVLEGAMRDMTEVSGFQNALERAGRIR